MWGSASHIKPLLSQIDTLPSANAAQASTTSAIADSIPQSSNTPELSTAAAPDASPTPSNTSETAQLQALGANVRGQEDLEDAVGRQADQMLLEQADERDTKRIEKTLATKAKLEAEVRSLKDRQAANPHNRRTQSEINELDSKVSALDQDLKEIQERIAGRHRQSHDAEDGAKVNETSNKRRPGETRREYLIRTGKITPFSKIGLGEVHVSSNLGEVMMDAEQASDVEEDGSDEDAPATQSGPKSHVNLLKPGFADEASSAADSAAEAVKTRPRKKRKLYSDDAEPTNEDASDASYTLKAQDHFADSEDESESFAHATEITSVARTRISAKKSKASPADSGAEELTGIDDGKESWYQARLDRWTSGRQAARRNAEEKKRTSQAEEIADSNIEGDAQAAANPAEGQDEAEWYRPHPTRADAEFDGGFRVPGDVYPSLFDYQKTGVRWLWELYQQQVGGIVGDEMGLGKTIQVIAFLAGLHYSKKYDKPIIIVCPATVMKQWVNEFHTWWPPFRVSILHSSGSGMININRESRIDDEPELWDREGKPRRSGNVTKAAKKIVDRVVNEGHVLVTTYAGLQSYGDILVNVPWGYAVLDEGHKIRNPNSHISIFCKSLDTHNRIITSGTPIQNNLIELWSLFDFVFPMRLGNLLTFRRNFEVPIREGGYANASNLQVQTALNCAEALKDAISPYLLQRWKSDVAADLPTKSEQVLFCKLTPLQLDMYQRFTGSREKDEIMSGRRNALWGIDILRKICNHPDLMDHKILFHKSEYPFGAPEKSGKMTVVKMLLQLWVRNGHKTLLFAQHRIMLNILERLIKKLPGVNYCRMDGSTPIKERQDMIDDFNKDPSMHVFLLTTKVGGLGVNLTSADRVIIYDPDWNPSTDVQARERAWRLGQKREVMIYRLMMAGTIEEKIYHRQLFKQFLTNKILKDPKQRQTFHLQGLQDLFSLNDPRMEKSGTETGDMFKGAESRTLQDGTESVDKDLQNHDAEVSAIEGVARSEAFRAPSEDSKQSTSTTSEPPTATGDKTPPKPPQNHLLDSLLSQSGVSITLNHDAILASSSNNGRDPVTGKVLADPATIQREAKRIAAEAANELRRAGEEARNVPIGTVTWTGEVGDAGRSGAPSRGGISNRGSSRGGRGGPTSANVLANLSQRQNHQNDGARRTADRGDSLPHGKEFMGMIRDYLKTHGGRVFTQMLVDHFNRFCTNPQRTAEFHQMLKTIARMEKPERVRVGARAGRAGGRAVWILKDEYK
ncbi:MAG: hypothetical protein Q9162_004519 [Coniocarpon cinnabarinum]